MAGLVDDLELFGIVGEIEAAQLVQIVVFLDKESDVCVVFDKIGVEPVELVTIKGRIAAEGDQF